MTAIEEFIHLPESTQKFLVDLVKKNGMNPMGDRLIRQTRIHQISYGPKLDMTWRVGQSITIPNPKGSQGIKAKIIAIYFDWLTSTEISAPVHAVLSRREDGIGGDYVSRYICTSNFDVVCKPPEESHL